MKKAMNSLHAVTASALALTALSVPFAGSASAAQVFTQDVIVQGSLCVGVDCTSTENFGADTIRLKENNLRIHFDDTSNSGSFPNNDWRIEVNNSQNGGANYYAIQDATSGRYVTTIEAGAPSNSIYVDSSGSVGFGTNAPNTSLSLHAADGNTPGLRLEQNTSSGFSAQTWDLAGNEANFFLRDVTNGSQLPIRVIPGADSGAFVISANNNIGMGLANNDVTADAALHIRRGGAGNDGLPRIRFENTDAPNVWVMDVSDNGDFRVSIDGSGVQELLISSTGAVTIPQLANCTNGIRSSAAGLLSCLP
ncbi:MAG: hypothetical protein KDJ80_06985 [Nitratireductor sp.]|nr:hypothetical protein [Nitratireductor sp.]